MMPSIVLVHLNKTYLLFQYCFSYIAFYISCYCNKHIIILSYSLVLHVLILFMYFLSYEISTGFAFINHFRTAI